MRKSAYYPVCGLKTVVCPFSIAEKKSVKAVAGSAAFGVSLEEPSEAAAAVVGDAATGINK